MNRFRCVSYCIKKGKIVFSGSSTKPYLIIEKDLVKSIQKLYCSSHAVLNESNTLNISQSKNTDSSKEVFRKIDSLDKKENQKIVHDVSEYGSVASPSFNFAAYADHSAVLQEFIKLGVELYKLETDAALCEFIVTLDFEKNVKPYLTFLNNNGVLPENFGQIITKYPLIFKEDLNDLEVRINYLKSKKFDRQMISKIITEHPRWLSIPVVVIDERLGYLQHMLKLTGDEVRKIISLEPYLATINKKSLSINIYCLKEEMNFDEFSIKKMLVISPSLLKAKSYNMIQTYDYLTKVMKVQMELIKKQPQILLFKKNQINERHKFLELIGRAQYNSKLPGYVGLLDLMEVTDAEFCDKIAKTSVHTYNEFLKTL